MAILSSLLFVLLPVLLGILIREPVQHPAKLLAGSSKDSRVLLVTAHPDDETFFFSPTILAYTKASVEVHALCLSSGNADGLGDARRKEFAQSLDLLGIPENRRLLVDDPNLQDDLKTSWSPKDIAPVIGAYVSKHRIQTILTFDEKGITDHPNHKSLFYGVSEYIKSIPPSSPRRPRLFTLITVPIPMKYSTILSPLLAKYDLFIQRIQQHVYRFALRKLTEYSAPGEPVNLSDDEHFEDKRTIITVYVSGISEFRLALQATVQHWSQMVWFRWLNVAFSRYFWVNEWSERSI